MPFCYLSQSEATKKVICSDWSIFVSRITQSRIECDKTLWRGWAPPRTKWLNLAVIRFFRRFWIQDSIPLQNSNCIKSFIHHALSDRMLLAEIRDLSPTFDHFLYIFTVNTMPNA